MGSNKESFLRFNQYSVTPISDNISQLKYLVSKPPEKKFLKAYSKINISMFESAKNVWWGKSGVSGSKLVLRCSLCLPLRGNGVFLYKNVGIDALNKSISRPIIQIVVLFLFEFRFMFSHCLFSCRLVGSNLHRCRIVFDFC